MPMASTRKLTPWKKPGMSKKMSRGAPLTTSRPTAESTRPMKMEKKVFGMSSPPSPMKVAKASIISANSSGEPKASATFASGGAKRVNRITEMVPPTKEAAAATTSARSASPFIAIGRPSKVVATAVEAPGIPSMMELMAPPYMAP
jgi:hypothetical protein